MQLSAFKLQLYTPDELLTLYTHLFVTTVHALAVGVLVGVDVFVAVSVGVGEKVGVDVLVGVCVGVKVGVDVFVGVCVEV